MVAWVVTAVLKLGLARVLVLPLVLLIWALWVLVALDITILVAVADTGVVTVVLVPLVALVVVPHTPILHFVHQLHIRKAIPVQTEMDVLFLRFYVQILVPSLVQHRFAQVQTSH
jgi:hypothetical protein